MPRIFYISSRVATQSPVLKTCHSKLNNLVAGNDAMKPLATGIYCNIIFRTPVHISAITIFLHFPKTFQFSICVAGERKEDDLILSPVTCGIVVNWKKDIKYPFEGQDTITLWRWKLLYYLCLKTVYNGWQQLKCIPLIKGQHNVMCYFALSFLQVPPSKFLWLMQYFMCGIYNADIRIMLFKYFDHVAISFKSWQQCKKF